MNNYNNHNEDAGWVKVHRKMLANPVVMKDPDYLAVWIYLLLNASHKRHPTIFNGKKIILQPGQLVTGRRAIAVTNHISESKVKRILNAFKIDQQIDQQGTPHGSLITILEWDKYQNNDQQNDRQVTNKRPTSDQQATTIQECKECKNDKNREGQAPVPRSVIQDYVTEHNLAVDVEVFWNYYEENHWRKKNGQPVTDWVKTLSTWAAREKKYKLREPKPDTIEPPKYRAFTEEEYEKDGYKSVPMPDDIKRRIEDLFG